MASIRVAEGDADIEALVELRRVWTEERRGVGPDRSFAERFRAWFTAEADHRTFWLAEVDGRAVGMTNLLTFERMPSPQIDAGRWGYLGNMFVLPDHRDAGVGRLLLNAVVAQADERGFERIVLSPTERSVPFYRRVGFDDAYQLLVRPHAG
jgi:GNAT superfamily N-acetyltransferase